MTQKEEILALFATLVMRGQRGAFRKGYAEGILSTVLDHLLRENMEHLTLSVAVVA